MTTMFDTMHAKPAAGWDICQVGDHWECTSPSWRVTCWHCENDAIAFSHGKLLGRPVGWEPPQPPLRDALIDAAAIVLLVGACLVEDIRARIAPLEATMTALDDDRRETIAESSWESEPSCPKCGVRVEALCELLQGESESDWECDNCGALLEVHVEYSADYMLRHYKPSKRDLRLKREAEKRSRESDDYLRRTRVEREAKHAARERRRAHSPTTWREFTWEDWVPASVRKAVESAHRDGPFSYTEALRDKGSPQNGMLLVIGRDTCREVTGRYVYAWGNIGRLVEENGTVHCVSFHPRDGSYNVTHLLSGGGRRGGGCPSIADTTPADCGGG